MKNRSSFNLLLAIALCAPISAVIGAPPEQTPAHARVDADSIFFNGKVITMDAASAKTRIVQAFAIKDGRFIATGSDGEAMRYKGRDTRVVDLLGRTVLPGLSDGHFHGIHGGPGVDLSKARTLQDVFDAVAARAVITPAGDFVISNSDWHEAQLQEQRLPLASELDIAAPNNPVVLVRGGHSFILNNVALARFNITTSTPVPPGGAIPRTPEGELTGELIDSARNLVQLPPNPPQTPEQQRQALLDIQSHMNAHGVTQLRMASSNVSTYRRWQALRDEGAISLRVSFLFRPGNSANAVNNFVATSGVTLDEGDQWLKVVGFKFGVDGGFEGGLMREPYIEPYGLGGTYFGLQTVNTQGYIDTIKAVALNGWRAATHAVGDAGIDLVLEAYKQAHAARPYAKGQWVIEHAFVAKPDHFPKIRELGLVLSVQDHLYVAGPSLRKMWGDHRAEPVTPVKTYLDQGFLLAGGTDAPVIPTNPWWAMYHFITRDTITGGVFGPQERVLNREDVLRLFTLNYARLIHEEDSKGSISPGKWADFVIASGDFLSVPMEALEDMTALATYVGGKRVHLAPELQPGDF
jgi:predicted amidohydrolase YtcJ